jgi:FkbM family methyltransferase
MANSILNLIIAIIKVSRDPRIKSKLPIVLTYTKLKLKNMFKSGPGQETILGCKFDYFEYSTLTYLFEEIFVYQSYYFASDKKTPIIFDCGSNIGMSILYFKLLFPGAIIYSFEPDPESYSLIKKNISQNKLSDVHTHNIALSNETGTLKFFKEDKKGSLVMSRHQVDSHSHSIKVPCHKLSEYMNQQIDYLKIDIEGGEEQVFEDLAQSGKLSNVLEYSIEYHLNKNDSMSMGAFLTQLENSGYQYNLSGSPNLKGRFKPHFQDVHIYAVKG